MPAVDRGIEIGEIIVGADSFWLDQKATKGSLPEYIILKKCREGWSETSFPASVLFLFYQSCRHPHHNSAIRTAAAISYKCFAKPTIILSYPFVYWFKPICYGMRVAILNYHSSVITIMVKNDNFLCVNCTIKTGTVREQVRNLLKRLLFSSRQAFLLSKTDCKAA